MRFGQVLRRVGRAGIGDRAGCRGRRAVITGLKRVRIKSVDPIVRNVISARRVDIWQAERSERGAVSDVGNDVIFRGDVERRRGLVHPVSGVILPLIGPEFRRHLPRVADNDRVVVCAMVGLIVRALIAYADAQSAVIDKVPGKRVASAAVVLDRAVLVVNRVSSDQDAIRAGINVDAAAVLRLALRSPTATRNLVI